MQDLSGLTIDRYHLIEPLGQGGMAIVYKAFDTRLEREVAIKLIRRNAFSPDVLERVLKRFDREAKSLARLTHPNIVSIIDYGEYEGSPYLVMPYLVGGTLKLYLGSPIPYTRAVELLLPIADSLSYAHQKGIVHRDIKPGNILITEGGQSMLTDFGIARLLDNEDSQTLTATGVGVGTPEYMSPEQGIGREVDGRSDVYSLGVVLFELITGQKPYTADTPMAVVLKQTSEPLPRPSLLVPDLPDAVERVLLKSLAKNPVDRYQNMNDLVVALSRLERDEKETGVGNYVFSLPVAQEVAGTSTTDQLKTELNKLKPEQKKNQTQILQTIHKKNNIAKWVYLLFGAGVIALIGISYSLTGAFSNFAFMKLLATTPTFSSEYTLPVTPDVFSITEKADQITLTPLTMPNPITFTPSQIPVNLFATLTATKPMQYTLAPSSTFTPGLVSTSVLTQTPKPLPSNTPKPILTATIVNRSTTITITNASPNPCTAGDELRVEFRVIAANGGQPTGQIQISDLTSSTFVYAAADGTGAGYITCYYPGEHTLYVSYIKEPNYDGSSDSQKFIVQ